MVSISTPVPNDHARPGGTVTPESAVPGPAAGPRRSGRGARDMALSMIVLLIPVAIVVAIFRFGGGEDVQVQDPAATFAEARASSAFPVAEPAGLADGWRSISADFRGGEPGAILRVGYLSPAGGTAQLIESAQPTDQLLPAELGDSMTNKGTVAIAGRSWQVFDVRNGEHALVDLTPGRTVIVIGGADLAELQQLAAALK